MVLTNSIRKQIISLGNGKHRRELGLFKAEGTKCVLDTLNAFHPAYIVATGEWMDQHAGITFNCDIVNASPSEMERISSLTTAPQIIAIYKLPEWEFSPADLADNLTIALDCVQDPGNLGTIIRTADWFGIRHIICSKDTVDVFSPKVVQATMGAISRVKVHYINLPETLSSIKDIPIYGTFLDGSDIYKSDLTVNGVIVMGNEGKGISPEVERLITKRLHIPSYPSNEMTSESLNVAIATAITLSEFRRR